METFEYLLLDIEWNQAEGTSGIEGREPVQIAIVGIDEQLEKQKIFSKAICPENMDSLTEKTCKVVHMTKELIMMANSEAIVYEKVTQSFPEYKYIVVWTKDTYDLFKAGMKKNHLSLPKHKVIIMQDVVGWIAAKKDAQIGFESALIQAGIAYEVNFLHYAKHDAEYLYQLFKHVYREYEELIKEEECIPNYTTGKLHMSGCRYIRDKENIPTAGKDLIFQGFIPCLCCGTEAEWRRLKWKNKKKISNHNLKIVKNHAPENLKKLPLSDKNIYRICHHFSLECSISVNMVFVRTPFGVWRVYYWDNNVTKVYHGNYRIKNSEFSKKKKCNEGFHEQNIGSNNFYEVIQYIYYHDKNFMKQREKSKIEILFEQLDKENKMQMEGEK